MNIHDLARVIAEFSKSLLVQRRTVEIRMFKTQVPLSFAILFQQIVKGIGNKIQFNAIKMKKLLPFLALIYI